MPAVSQNPEYPIDIKVGATGVKVNIGSGKTWSVAGWFGIDQETTPGSRRPSGDPAFLAIDFRKGLPFSTNSVDVIFSSHTLEHFTYQEGRVLLFEIYRVLKVGAPLCLVVPDMDIYISNYVSRNRDFLTTPEIICGTPRDTLADNFLMDFYSDPKFNNTCHKYAYSFENLSSALLETGFAEVQRVSFHDFSYWPELREREFRSQVPHIETCSLSVQCRKLAFDPHYQERTAFKEAREFARAGENEQQLNRQLNAALLLNESLQAQLMQARTELESRKKQPPPSLVSEYEINRFLEQNSSDAKQFRLQLESLLLAKLESDHALQLVRARWAASKGINGLIHYLREGASSGLTPSPAFDGNFYLAEYSDVANSGVNPLLHYVECGASEGRKTTPASPPILTQNLDHSQVQVAWPSNGAEFGLQFPVADQGTWNALEHSNSNRAEIGEVSEALYSPLISILLPVCNASPNSIREVVQAVQRQSYPKWELCIIGSDSTDEMLLAELNHIRHADTRIKLQLPLQSADWISGDYLAFVDQNIILAPGALSEVVEVLRKDPLIDGIYTDHASLNEEGVISSPSLKPDWSPEFFLSTNFVSRFMLLKQSLANEIGGVEFMVRSAGEIALIWKLAERGLKIFHLQKVLYFERTHSAPAISATRQAHREHLARVGVDASVFWPDHFRDLSIDAYKLQFPDHFAGDVAIVIPVLGAAPQLPALLQSLKRTSWSRLPQVHLIGNLPSPNEIPDSILAWHSAGDQEEFNNLVAGIDCDSLVFLSAGALIISSGWLIEILGYLSVSSEIGAVGGKILDDRLNVQAGGLLLMDKPQTISSGESDESDGHSFRNRLASNVEAVSAKLMATTKQAYAKAGGLPIFEYGDAAGIAYCLRLRDAGYRVVYNPWSKIVDAAEEKLPANYREMLERDFGGEQLQDRYYHPFFSRDVPYAL